MRRHGYRLVGTFEQVFYVLRWKAADLLRRMREATHGKGK